MNWKLFCWSLRISATTQCLRLLIGLEESNPTWNDKHKSICLFSYLTKPKLHKTLLSIPKNSTQKFFFCGQGSKSRLCIYYVLSLSTELSSRRLAMRNSAAIATRDNDLCSMTYGVLQNNSNLLKFSYDVAPLFNNNGKR